MIEIKTNNHEKHIFKYTPAALGRAIAATSSVVKSMFASRAFFHLSTATKMSSAPIAKMTNKPMKFKKGKLFQGKNKISRKLVKESLMSK